ncbi:MAG: SpoIIE family protein phosphatase [Candidatus Riflebacteria bacterium]|nr:SpoIIE family protein phosphatase [Candidatus Riflebacteria bacterium]
MNRHPNWLALVLVIWGIPSLLVWILVGVFLFWKAGRDQATLIEEVRECVETTLQEAEPTPWLTRRLNGELQDLPRLATPPSPLRPPSQPATRQLPLPTPTPLATPPSPFPSASRFARHLESLFPPNSVRVLLFNRKGRLVTDPLGFNPDRVERIFQYLRTPWSVPVHQPPELFDAAQELVPGFHKWHHRVRGQADLVTETGPSEQVGGGITHVLWHWAPEDRAGPVRGALVLIHANRFPRDFVFRAVIGGHSHPHGILLAGETGQDPPVLSPGLATSVYEACREVVVAEPAGSAQAAGFLAVGRTSAAVRTLGLVPGPGWPWGPLAGFGLFHLAASLVVWRFLRGAVDASRPLQMSLGRKLGGLMGMGIVFPLAGGILVGWLLVQDAESAARGANRKQVLQALEGIDRGFERVMRDREIRIRSHLGTLPLPRLAAPVTADPVGPPGGRDPGVPRRQSRGQEGPPEVVSVSPPAMRETPVLRHPPLRQGGTSDLVSVGTNRPGEPFACRPLRDLVASLQEDQDRLRFDEYFIVSSAAVLVEVRKYNERSGLHRLTISPSPAREDGLLFLLRRGWDIDHSEVEYFERAVAGRPGRVYALRERKETIAKLMITVAREAMNTYNLARGLAPLPAARGGNLLVSGLAEDDLGEGALAALTRQGHLIHSRGMTADGYLLADVVAGPGGGANWYVVVTFNYGNLVHEYLAEWCRHPPGGPGTRLVAFPTGRKMEPPLPDVAAGLLVMPVAERAERQPALPVQTVMTTASGTFDVVARVCSTLPGYALVHLTPVAHLQTAVAATALGVGLVSGLVALFCAALTWLTVRRLLDPVGSLTRGVAAMRARDFTQRLPAEGKGELADLFRAFNRAMAHLADTELAAVVQSRIFPGASLTAGPFRVAAHNRMTQATGGDFLDFFPLADGRLVAALGDVTGHGISAALVTAMAKAALGVLARRHPDDPVEILRGMNRHLLSQLDRKRAMTCVVAVLDPAAGRARFANAGQCYPLLLVPGREPRFLRTVSYPLGVSRRWGTGAFELDPVADLPPGACLMFYTDGLVEPMSPGGEPVGFDRLAALAAQAVATAPAAPGPALFEAVHAWTNPVPWPDDASALFIQRFR